MIGRRKFSLIALLAAAALSIGLSGLTVPSALAKSSRPKVLFQDPLSKPDRAVEPALHPPGQGEVTWTFVNHQLLGQDRSPDDYHLYGFSFKATAEQLANYSIDAQATLLPNTQSVGGIACRYQGGNQIYGFVIYSSNEYEIYKAQPSSSHAQSLVRGPVRLLTTNQLRFTCAGPVETRAGGTVTLTGVVNGQPFSIQDSSAAYSAGPPYLVVGTYGQTAGGASFSNVKVTQN